MTVNTRMWLLGVTRTEGLCNECFLPGLFRMSFLFDVGGNMSIVDRVSCFDCGALN